MTNDRAPEIPEFRIVRYEAGKACGPDAGDARWESDLLPRIVDIALQWPQHFIEDVARHAIPFDASRHATYLCLSVEDGKVLGFLVVIETYAEVEALWGAVDRDLAVGKSHIFRALFARVEDDSFNRQGQGGALTVFGKIPTESSFCDGSEVEGSHWGRTYAFYEKTGYKKTYRLNHYWGEGNHAYIILKRNPSVHKPCYGYDRFELGRLAAPAAKEDAFPAINQELFQDIYPYLLGYKKGVHSIITEREACERELPDDVGDSLDSDVIADGFVGVAFLPAESDSATLFASTIDPSNHVDSFVSRYEFTIGASALTRILADAGYDEFSVVHYILDYDEDSELQVDAFFRSMIPRAATEEGYTVFAHKMTRGEDGSRLVFYMVVGGCHDAVVWAQRWRVVASAYSLLLASSLRSIIWALVERKYAASSGGRRAYLEALLRCVNLPAGWGEAFDELARKAADIVLDDTYSAMDAALAHDMKNVVSHTIIKPLHSLEDALDAVLRAQGGEAALKKARAALGRSIRSCEQYRSTLMRFLEGFRAIELGRSERGGGGGWVWTREALGTFVGKLLGNGAELRVEGDDDLQIGMPGEALEVLLQFIVSNIVDAFDAAADKQGGRKLTIEIRAENLRGLGEDGAVMDRFRFSIWNSGTQFPEHVLLSGGARPSTKYIKQNHSGMGLYFVERILRKANAIEFDCHDVRRHFCIENTDDPRGAKLCFEVPVSTI